MADYIPESGEPVMHQLCKSCGAQNALYGYPTALCADCRERYIKFPVPKWIWLFAAGIAVTMAVGLFRMPKYLNTAIHLARAEKAENAHRYITAQAELEKVLKIFPDDIPANGRMLIASVYNRDMKRAASAYERLEHEHIDDDDLLKEINKSMHFLELMSMADTVLTQNVEAVKDDANALENLYRSTDSFGTNGPVCGYLVADKLFDMKEYKRAEIVLQKVLDKEPDAYGPLSMLVAVKREQQDYDGAIAICDKLMERNKEDIGVLSAKTRVELKRKHDKDALKYANEAMALNSHDVLAMEAMAMAQFFNGQQTESKKLLTAVQAEEKISGDTTISRRLSKVLNGTEPYRQ